MATIETFVDALSEIGTRPYALVGYVILIVLWAYVVRQSRADRALYKSVRDLPLKDRLRAIEIARGDGRLRQGLTPEQWLRGRLHRYYLIAFLALLLIILLLAVIALVRTEPQGEKTEQVDASAEPVVIFAPKEGLKPSEILEQIDVGMSRKFAERVVGPPQYVNPKYTDRVSYAFPDFYLYLIYRENVVAAIGVISRNKKFKPNVRRMRGCLGCVSFPQLNGEPFWINLSTKDFIYIERRVGWSTADAGVSIYLLYSGFGVNYSKEHSCFFGIETMQDIEVYDGRKDEPYERARINCKPNGYAYTLAEFDVGTHSDEFRVWPEYPDPGIFMQ